MTSTERASLTRVLDAVAAAATDAGRIAPEHAVAVAREALRRVPDVELDRADLPSLARNLAAGADLLAHRTGAVDVAVLPPDPGRPHVGTVVQLAADDRPFLLSTVLDEIERRGRRVPHQLHPIVGVTRDEGGQVTAIGPPRDAPGRETLLHLVLDRALDDDEADELASRLCELASDVRAATDDFHAMGARLRQHAATIRGPADDAGDTPGTEADEATEVADLVDWLLDEHVVLLGTREYELLDTDGTPARDGGGPATALRVVPGSGLGILADEDSSRYDAPVALDELAGPLAETLRTPSLLAWSRTRRRSTVQRHVRMEHIALGLFTEQGRPAGILRVLALFTRRGEAAPADATPVLRRKLAAVLDTEDVVPGSHDEVVLTSVFQALPKDELFPADVDELRRLLLGLLHAEDHREVRVLLRVDAATRTVSAMVAVPRDTYSPQLRERVAEHLRTRFDADRVDVTVSLGDRNEALARFLLTLEREVPDVDAVELEDEVRALARSWVDEVTDLLASEDGREEADRLVADVARRLPRSYRDAVDPVHAVADLRLIDRVLTDGQELATDWQPDRRNGSDELPNRWRLRVVARGSALELSAFLPVLESLGLIVVEEVPHRLMGPDELHLHDFGVRVPDAAIEQLATDAGGRRAAEALVAAWRGHAQIDPLTRLVLLADVTWRDVGVLRAYRRYRRQLGTPYTPRYVEEILVEHAAATAAVLDHFHARFDPDLPGGEEARPDAESAAAAVFEDAMTSVTRLDADRILRGLAALVAATLRTNAFRDDAIEDDGGGPYVALKFDPSRIPDVPLPVPHREIFVHSPRVEGIHLRGGPVARGGLRWSDRRDDVRTEVLDLVKAQVLKNALIVPTGAKGGFVLAQPPQDPQALRDEVQRCYITFIRGLLDVTDDLDGTDHHVVPPPRVVRHDGDDPYLVVAADRGTATFSDTANAVAARYGFWLGDAFASGGSRGYDHKALGVTARGAWRAVARHFRELGIDVQTEPITAVGIGDLSGDVFSNGVQRSEHLRLVAAFDHRHIFLDPDPDPAASFAERARVAAIPRSSWDDYDRSVLSPGAMIVARDSRSVDLTDEVRERLRVDATSMSPPELIRAVLSAPVDLLWAGGIGTYVKASDERHEDVGDRANDEVRVDASRVRARVLGEGANLSITQRARIELARRGARVDQDAIHNAAGVATSDAEVNLKILLDLAIADGQLDPADRDAVLADLSEDVVAEVLDAVDRQVAAISAEVARGSDDASTVEAFIERLEARGDLDRDVEVLPSNSELRVRADAGAGLTRPELATLLAWAKRELKEALLASDAPEDPVLADAVAEPFPVRAVERFGALLPRHRLRRELVVTAVANTTVDRFGVTFASALAAETGVGLPLVARALRVATRIVDADRWWAEVDTLAATHDPERVRELSDVVDTLVIELTGGMLLDPLLRRDPVALLERDRAVAGELVEQGLRLGSNAQQRARIAHARWLVDDLVEPDLATFLAVAPDLAIVLDAASLTAASRDRTPVQVADVAFRLDEQLGLDRLAKQLSRVTPRDPWARRQHRGIDRDLRRMRRDATAAALAVVTEATEPPITTVERFVARHAGGLERALTTVTDLERDAASLDAVAVALRGLRDAVDL
ncbi:MAG: NAD-glutamate dehydrogenase domain-containing protein [Nitriliruptor sp.]|uniref:NAD-glutamate dehydrogenase domain-containing protein n=1 Tax=Nitriliruptor sp. TaxID=2448056 RepID=UPI0034A0ADC4